MDIYMNRGIFSQQIMAFCVCTTCITLLEGVLGMLFFPQIQMNYSAFFSPPLFGAFSVLFGLVNYSKKELSIRQVLIRRLLHLFMIEALVFGLNYASGLAFTPLYAWSLAFSVALVFVSVYVILWLIDRKDAIQFNERLKVYQSRERGE